VQVGDGLAAGFRVSDCLQVLTGEQLYMFDPCGKYFATAAADGKGHKQAAGRKGPSPAAPKAVAKVYQLRGSDLPGRFPDQVRESR
jgi:hypothetical protein